MKKSALIIVVIVILALVSGIVLSVKLLTKQKVVNNNDSAAVDLPVNTIPVSERPFITLTPDTSGRNLTLAVSGAPKEGSMEYEMVYQATDKQEGALGTLTLDSEVQPIEKTILLGSRSAGGATTYHEGVTGGSFTVTYQETRLKEQWNFLRFDPSDPVLTSPDARFSVMFDKLALKADTVVVTMKTFGLPIAIPAGNLVAGPYAFFTGLDPKGDATIEIKLPAGEHQEPTIYEWSGEDWTALKTALDGDSVTASATGNVFVVTAK